MDVSVLVVLVYMLVVFKFIVNTNKSTFVCVSALTVPLATLTLTSAPSCSTYEFTYLLTVLLRGARG